MENYITLFVATLEKLELLTAKEAQNLEKELKNTTIPSSYVEAQHLLTTIFDKIREKKIL